MASRISRAKIHGAPKADLHVHLEGTISPEMMHALAKRNNVDIGFDCPEAIAAAYEFPDLNSFLQVYYAGLRVLLSQDDFYAITFDHLSRAHEESTRYIEFYTSPQSHIERGIPASVMLAGIFRACDDAEAKWGIKANVIYGLQRHRNEADALAAIKEAEPFAERIIAIGLGGPERNNPPSRFVLAFERARELGWRTTVHAGEEGPANYISQALDLLRADRIDHGVAAEQDLALVARLAATCVPLTVCPISNVKLKVFDSLEQHNARRLLEAGCIVTFNTDDPSYFKADLTENIVRTSRALDLSDDQIFEVMRNGFEGAFCDRSLKLAMQQSLHSYWYN
jgi:adenosine deaminase